MSRIAAAACLITAAASLAACGSVKETINGPKMTAMGYPAALVPLQQPIMPQSEPQPASANSLWRAGARTFFHDQRARNVGDILTVQIEIDDSAQFQNSTSRSRSNGMKAGVPHLFGLESSLGKILPAGYDPSHMVDVSGSTDASGKGVIARAEKVSLTIAAVVTGILPNGNLVIQGKQEVKTNSELRELTVAGIVRPEDISSTNTIKHTQIAEARISYGGRGDVSRVQKSPAAQSLLERFSPF